jgi:hypothetical protein
VTDDSEARAALWRAQLQRRVAYQAALYQQLRGDPAAWQRLMEDWQPLILLSAEAQEAPVRPEDDPGFDPLHISDQVNVGT